MLCGSPQTLATTARRRRVRLLLRPSAEKEFVDLDCAAKRVLARQHQAQGMSHAPRRRLAHPSASAKRMDDSPLSDCRISHKPLRQVLRGSLVACNGVRVVAVNWKRQAPLEHWYRPGRALYWPMSRPASAIERLLPHAGQTRPLGHTKTSKSRRHSSSSRNASTISATVRIPNSTSRTAPRITEVPRLHTPWRIGNSSIL